MSAHTIPAGLYGVADATYGDPVEQAGILLGEGVRCVQLRCKGWDPARLHAAARLVHAHPLVVNDAVDVARDLGVWLHLGQDDGPDPVDVPFGRSTHTLEQAAAPGRAAYIGFGPVFGTSTKDTGYTARGIAMLAEAVRVSPVPVVAIGGIGPSNVEAVRQTGVHAWAVIGAIWTAPDARRAISAVR